MEAREHPHREAWNKGKLVGQKAPLKPEEATAVLVEVVQALKHWRAVAMSAEVGLSQAELEEFAPAFEHEGLDDAQALLA